MAGIERSHGDYGMGMHQIIRCWDVETGFVPEEGKAQQRRVYQENDDKDQRKDPSE
jgi:hypothetical protein